VLLVCAPHRCLAAAAWLFACWALKPHCLAGETAVKYSFGGVSCAPGCTGEQPKEGTVAHRNQCPPTPTASKITHGICMLSADGDNPATHCALHCNPQGECPKGASCHMPEGVCVYPLSAAAAASSLSDAGDVVMTPMLLTREPTPLERLWAHDDNGH
jgi:hypothetical protein